MVMKWISVCSLFIFILIFVNPIASQSESDVKPSDVTKTADAVIDPSASNVTLSNATDNINVTSQAPLTTTSSTTTTTTTTTTTVAPPITQNAVEAEKGSSLSIFFVLCVIALGILLIHLMLQTHFQYLPESIVTVCLGALIGLILNFTSVKSVFEREEVFSPTAFFLVLLPPIIFEVTRLDTTLCCILYHSFSFLFRVATTCTRETFSKTSDLSACLPSLERRFRRW